MDRTYKYTVCTRCFTYNHAPYILDALGGFIAQQTDFPVVYTIVDDASTDGEPQLLRNYFNENFEADDSKIAYKEEMDYGTVLFGQHRVNRNCFFALILLRDNHYSKKRSKLPYISRWQDNAKYIALCEGDDYWIDSHKLQKQVSYLDKHIDSDMIACSSFWIINGGMEARNYASDKPRVLSVAEVISGGGNFIPTCSLLFSRRYLDDIPKWRRMANVGDYPLQIQGALEGNLFYLPEEMCVYRRGGKGSWSEKFYSDPEMRIMHQRAELSWMEVLNKSTKCRYKKEIFGRFKFTIHTLFLYRKASIKEYCYCVGLVGSPLEKKRMIKRIIKRLIHYNP